VVDIPVVDKPRKVSHVAARLSDIGVRLMHLDMLDEAILVLECAAELDPHDGMTHTNLGHAYQEKGLAVKAMAEYELAIEIDPNLKYAYEGLGSAYASKGLFNQAVICFKHVVDLDPGSSVAHHNLGRAYNELGTVNEATKELKRASELDRSNADIHNDLGVAYTKKGLADESIAEYNLAIELNSNNGIFHANLGNQYYYKGLWDKALKEYERAMKLKNKLEVEELVQLHNNLGATYAQMKMWDKAFVEFKQAIRLDPNLEIAQTNFLIAQNMKGSQKEGDFAASKRKARTLALIDEEILEVPITKGQMGKAENAIEKWFQQLKGNVLGELAFIDKTTFGYLDSIPKCCGIRIIVSNIKDSEACKVKAEKCSRDRPYLDIVTITKLHKRWIGSNESFFIEIGSDLKTDALGHSTHTIRKLEPENYQKEVEQFEVLWTKTEEQLSQTYGQSSMTKSLFFSTSRRD